MSTMSKVEAVALSLLWLASERTFAELRHHDSALGFSIVLISSNLSPHGNSR